MVNENTDNTSSSNNCFNFQFSSSNQNFRSLSNSLNTPNAINAVNTTKQLDLLVATNETLNKKKCDLLSVSADNLSWKFFEQIDSLDTRLRKEESTTPLINDDRILLSSGCRDDNDDNVVANVDDFEDMQSKQFQIQSHGHNYSQNDKRPHLRQQRHQLQKEMI
ncbi:uncharacterized protein ACN427_010408 isoform 1-T1 [Glossina fuscipes fuscipes]